MLLDTTNLALFLITALVILVTTGPAVLYIIARSVDQGRVAGIVFFRAQRCFSGSVFIALGVTMAATGQIRK